MTLRYRYCYVLIALMITSTATYGQRTDEEQDQLDRATYRNYDTQKYEEYICGTGSGKPMEMRRDWDKLVREIEDKVAEREREIKIEPTTIEVIFHILSTDDVRTAQQLVASQIEALNRDFNNESRVDKHPNDPTGKYLQLAASTQLQFELARDEEARVGPGIAIVSAVGERWEGWDQMKSREYGGSPAIQPSKYLNVWVCDLPPDRSSYSSTPYVQTAEDGIVIDARYFGVQEKGDPRYNQGKTLTHLAGNYLGLKDLWSEGEPCLDDYVDDTPVHNAMNSGTPKYKHITTCESDKLIQEMTMNFMDNTDDHYQTMFTAGQIRRAHAFSQVTRPSILSSNKKMNNEN